MIAYLSGRLSEKNPAYAIIECSGVGYLVHISSHTYSSIKDEEQCKLLIHYSISVDVRSGASNHLLFGFSQKLERDLFRHLITVSGVSVNTARLILSSYNPNEIISAIVSEEKGLITTIKGIGPKLAQRIINDLKDKLEKNIDSSEITLVSNNTIKEEALSALVALGFAKLPAAKTIDKLIASKSANISVEELLKEALRLL